MKKDKDYTYRSMRDERQYGFYWYSGLWHVLRPILVGLTVLVLVVGIGTTVWNKLYGEFAAPADAADGTEVVFEIESGESLNRIAAHLEEAGLIRSRTAFKYYCDFVGMGQKIQVGSYTLKKSMSMTEVADVLAAGDTHPLVRNITLIPGETIEDFAAKLVKNGVLESADRFLELCRTGTEFSDYYYIADVLATPNVSQRKYVLEGYLAPNTYEVYINVTEEEIIRKLLSQTEAVFPDEYEQRAAELGMTMDQVLTLASMIEKEAKKADFAKVSAVFHNRQAAGMKLQSDVTIHYITGVRKMALTESDTQVNNAYNTYLITGLPPGPICNPSPDAIRAALYPDEIFLQDKYLYFCAREPASGELYFSRTLEEHERAVSEFRKSWEQYDQSRGIP